MRRSSFEQPIAAKLRENAAMPYDSTGQPIVGGAHTYPEQAAAGLWTTPSDLALFAINLQHVLAGQGRSILSTATAHEMVTSVGKGSWGLGFGVGGTEEDPYFTHGGANEGFRCLLTVFDAGDGIVVMSNGDRGAQIATALLRTVAAEYGWPHFQPKYHKIAQLPVAAFDRFVGQYRVNADDTIEILRKDNRLYFQPAGQEAGEILPDGPVSFFSKGRDIQITFQPDAEVRASGLRIVTGDSTIAAERIE
jgi:CubicO group peptidase (beta-lactamase class C family)